MTKTNTPKRKPHWPMAIEPRRTEADVYRSGAMFDNRSSEHQRIKRGR